MTPEEQQREARLAAAKADLTAAIQRLPFDIQTAGATRINVWKLLVDGARKLLRRNPRDAAQYEEYTRRLRACASAPVESLVEGVYEKKD